MLCALLKVATPKQQVLSNVGHQYDACIAGSVQEHSDGQSNLARLFANGTAENLAAKESKQSNGGLPKLLNEAQVGTSCI